MSKTLSSVAVTVFDEMVKQAYQTMGATNGGIADAVTQRNNVVGDTYKFRGMGKGLANQKSTAAEVTPMDIAHSFATAVLENWLAPEYTDIFDQAEVNFDEKQELAYTIAGALYRRREQLIIDSMDAATVAIVPDTIGTANLNVEKILRASKELNDAGVPMDKERHIATSASGLEAMLGETQVGSSDFSSVRALMTGELNFWMGFNWHIVEARVEGGLSIDGGLIRSSYAWHKEAVGIATALDITTEVNWIPHRTAWLANGIMKSGTAIREEAGVVRILHDET